MLLVVDSNVVAKWFFPEELQQQALTLQSDWMSGAVDLVAPDLILTEVSNITWKKQRLSLITPTEAIGTIEDLLLLSIPTVESQTFLRQAYSLASRFDRTVYDALYLALAAFMPAKLVTADLRLYNAVSSQLEFVQYLGNY
ncbi:type II toxin-antitoxin system VapC family toxin [Chroococcidiopsis sp. FACHB-1243]|uniref:type II toxin-antitoxin system VapC family toxin n=1 Tax=Chroococcidiopsis sp. [FACHB-1243] TaxID=2692781 RepID=UPI0017840148|nr:type II toxin-antitoxin system VapC family toxin [Chroococcidiopsis sp. [FACHB-1243]]MBD2310039.1 type II toxin-antitoxin system VapC family toxin [Chroococcidiopsis sp. [FACHB-1243]]